MENKKLMALRAAALVTAVSGATLIMSAGSAVQAAEESCWQNPRLPTEKERHVRGCAFDQYGLLPGLRPADGNAQNGYSPPDVDTGEGGSGGPNVDPGPPDPVDPYTSN